VKAALCRSCPSLGNLMADFVASLRGGVKWPLRQSGRSFGQLWQQRVKLAFCALSLRWKLASRCAPASAPSIAARPVVLLKVASRWPGPAGQPGLHPV
jgi:hypothetical protein